MKMDNIEHTDTKILILPSDAGSKFYPDNTSSEFTIPLPEVLDFEKDYEVALAEIQIPNKSKYRLPDNEYIYFEIFDPTEALKILHPNQISRRVDKLNYE